MTEPTDTETTTQTEGTGWAFPFDEVLDRERTRIDGHEDMVPLMVQGWYEGAERPQWFVTTVGSGAEITARDAGLHALRLLTAATGCDYTVLSFDSHATSLRENPVTGKPWGPGEMQAMCDEQGFCETGQMVDVLQVAVVRRSDGKIHMAGIPYHFHKGELILYDAMPDGVPTGFNEWAPDDTQVYQTVGGLMPDAMREAMLAPTLNSYLPPAEQTDTDRISNIMIGAAVLARSAEALGHPDLYSMAMFAVTEPEAEFMTQLCAEGASAENTEGADTRSDIETP